MPIRRGGHWIPPNVTFENTVKLADRVMTGHKERGLGMPTLVFIGRGGVELSGVVRGNLGIGAANILHVGIQRINAENSQAPAEFKVGQFPTDDEINGKHLVAIDAVWRSGQKMRHTVDLLKQHNPASVESGVVFDMTPPLETTDSQPPRPDYSQIAGYN